MKIKKVLIANRGEIAVRIIGSCKSLGISTVAIFSDADRYALHAILADEAYYVGESPSNQSYLSIENIINIAKKAQVDAIHPGYGFLSEQVAFAEEVLKNRIIFIGPSPSTIHMMGDKLIAKETVKAFHIPMIPGSDGAIENFEQAKSLIQKIGYPILIKAAGGGGGKGMRVVTNEEDFASSFERAKSEALAAFNNGEVFIEKYVESPRHIEIQVIADSHGNICHIFERECSIQRRHQKVIEEAPSSILSEELRNRMGEASIQVAKSCNYVGVGTVEFLVDKDLNFYFLEMNTRLQVEHPVTEMISGKDLVALQLLIANGEKLPFQQNDLKINGHSIELRVYAEDPFHNFLPSIGTLTTYSEPKGENIRVDSGYIENDEIPVFYDPMIAKLVVWGKDRNDAIIQMQNAIENFKIEGIMTTLPFGQFALHHESFLSGKFDTAFIEKFFSESIQKKLKDEEFEMVAFIANVIYKDASKKLIIKYID